jgi:hypothetical protein
MLNFSDLNPAPIDHNLSIAKNLCDLLLKEIIDSPNGNELNRIYSLAFTISEQLEKIETQVNNISK